MPVYIVVFEDYDSNAVNGVFSSKEKAFKFISQVENKHPHYRGYYSVEKWSLDGSYIDHVFPDKVQ